MPPVFSATVAERSLRGSAAARPLWRRLRDAGALPALVVVASLIVLLYRELALWWWGVWTRPEPDNFYRHAALAPLLMARMCWARREKWARLEPQPSWWGALLIVPGMALCAAGQWGSMPFVQGISLVLLTLGCLLWTLGRRAVALAFYPAVFAIFMLPLPGALVVEVALPLQAISARFAEAWLGQLGFYPSRSGGALFLSGYALDARCAYVGLSLLLATGMLAGFMAFLARAPRHRKVLLMGSALPIAVLVHALWMVGVAAAGQGWNARVAETLRTPATLLAWGVAFLLLLLLARVMLCP